MGWGNEGKYGFPGRGNCSSQDEGDREGFLEEVWCPLFEKYGNDMQEWATYTICERVFLGGRSMGSFYSLFYLFSKFLTINIHVTF